MSVTSTVSPVQKSSLALTLNFVLEEGQKGNFQNVNEIQEFSSLKDKWFLCVTTSVLFHAATYLQNWFLIIRSNGYNTMHLLSLVTIQTLLKVW
jgi:hypothetical protein